MIHLRVPSASIDAGLHIMKRVIMTRVIMTRVIVKRVWRYLGLATAGAFLMVACNQNSRPVPGTDLDVARNHELQTYCAFGAEELKLEDDATVDCSVGSNGKTELQNRSVAGGDAVSSTYQVILHDDARVEGYVDADEKVEVGKRARVGRDVGSRGDVELKEDARVDGSVTAADTVKRHDTATVGGSVTEGANVARIPELTIPGYTFSPGGSNVEVGKNQTRTLPPGRYKDVKVDEGATLNLSSGHYTFKKLEVQKRALVDLDLDTGARRILIDVVDTVVFKDGGAGEGARMTIRSAGGSAADILFRIQKGDVELGKHGTFLGTFVGAESTMTLKEDATSTGAFYGKKLTIKQRADFRSSPVGLDTFLAPLVTITSPANGTRFTEGDAVAFNATAEDFEDGTLNYGITWTSDFDGVLGSGPSLSSDTLSTGTHTITATVTDSDNRTGSAGITLHIDAAPSVTTLEVRVAEGSDDAEERAPGTVNRTSTDLQLVFDQGANQTVGIRFVGLTVPPGALITHAHIQFQTDESNAEATELDVRGEAADDAAGYSGTTMNISSRPTTTASVAWSPPAWTTLGEAGADQRTPDLSPIIQDIINRPGWGDGNALAVIITGTGERTAESYDGDPSGAPLLHLEYRHNLAIESFSATPDATELGEPITFDWSVLDLDGDPLSCSLDTDGDGTPEYSIADCDSASRLTHVYAAKGIHTARFSATDGISVISATAQVNVVNPNTVTVAAAGDIACDPASSNFNGGNGTSNSCHMLAVSELVLAENPDAVLVLGDIQYEEGTLAQFMQSYELSWGRFRSITYPAVGNHEYLTPGAEGYFEYFGDAAGDPSKGYYSTDLGNWHIISLNSNCSMVAGCRAGSPQERWLRADLAAHASQCTLAFWHHPRFSSGAIGGRDWTLDLWYALQEAGADIVLVGHDHNYERFAPQDGDGNADPNGLRQFVVGTGGKNHTSIQTAQANSEVRHSGTYGVLKLSLHPDSYEWEFIGEAGDTFSDRGGQACQ